REPGCRDPRFGQPQGARPCDLVARRPDTRLEADRRSSVAAPPAWDREDVGRTEWGVGRPFTGLVLRPASAGPRRPPRALAIASGRARGAWPGLRGRRVHEEMTPKEGKGSRSTQVRTRLTLRFVGVHRGVGRVRPLGLENPRDHRVPLARGVGVTDRNDEDVLDL